MSDEDEYLALRQRQANALAHWNAEKKNEVEAFRLAAQEIGSVVDHHPPAAMWKTQERRRGKQKTQGRRIFSGHSGAATAATSGTSTAPVARPSVAIASSSVAASGRTHMCSAAEVTTVGGHAHLQPPHIVKTDESPAAVKPTDSMLVPQLARGICIACGEESHQNTTSPARAIENGFVGHVLVCMMEGGELGAKIQEARKEVIDAIDIFFRGTSAGIAVQLAQELRLVRARIDRFPEEHISSSEQATDSLRTRMTQPLELNEGNSGTTEDGTTSVIAHAVCNAIRDAKSNVERELGWLQSVSRSIGKLEGLAFYLADEVVTLRKLAGQAGAPEQSGNLHPAPIELSPTSAPPAFSYYGTESSHPPFRTTGSRTTRDQRILIEPLSFSPVLPISSSTISPAAARRPPPYTPPM